MAKKNIKKGMKLLPSFLLILVVAVTFGFSALQVMDFSKEHYDVIYKGGEIIGKGDELVAAEKENAKKWEVYNIPNLLKQYEEKYSDKTLATMNDYQALKTSYTYTIVMMALACVMAIPFLVDILNVVSDKASKKKSNVTFCINLLLAIGVIIMAGLAMAQLLPLFKPATFGTVSIASDFAIGLAYPLIIGIGGALVIVGGVIKVVKK